MGWLLTSARLVFRIGNVEWAISDVRVANCWALNLGGGWGPVIDLTLTRRCWPVTSLRSLRANRVMTLYGWHLACRSGVMEDAGMVLGASLLNGRSMCGLHKLMRSDVGGKRKSARKFRGEWGPMTVLREGSSRCDCLQGKSGCGGLATTGGAQCVGSESANGLRKASSCRGSGVSQVRRRTCLP